MRETLQAIIANPYFNFLTGLVLIVTSGKEILASASEGIGAHHGVILLGLQQTIKTLPHILEGLEKLSIKRSKDERGGNSTI